MTIKKKVVHIKLSFVKDERGQALILFALMLPVLCGFIALFVDIGWITYNKTKIQNAADLSAIAAAQDLPNSTTQAYQTAIDYFEANYGSAGDISNINFFNSNCDNCGIKVHYEKTIPLFFAPIFGMNDSTISGKAEVVIEPIVQPSELIPIAIFHTTDLQYGTTNTIFGDNDTIGNFGIVDPSFGYLADLKATQNDEAVNTQITEWIKDGYKQADADLYSKLSPKRLPRVGDKIPTITGKRTGPVYKGFDARILEGRTRVICPIADFTEAKSNSEVPILGFAAFDSVSVTEDSEKVTVTGKFVEYIDSETLTGKADYYGIRGIRLAK